MLGLDTGFFVMLLKGNATAVDAWKRLISGEEQAACSCLSLFELQRLASRGALERPAVALLVEAAGTLCPPQWIDTTALLSQAVGLAHGLGLPAVDSMILASLLRAGANTIYTTDGDFERFRKPGVAVVNLASAA